MKGIVFTEFLEMVEEKFGYEVVDEIISKSELKSNGVYTSIGTYASKEMVSLVNHLHQKTQIDLNVLYEVFGEYLFNSLMRAYGHMFVDITDSFQMLKAVDQHIHVQVVKLYPDAELPKFEVDQLDDKTLKMIYSSERRMSDLAVGLIKGCLKHFNENAHISKRPLVDDGKIVEFIIVKA
jgi:hypothetical protein